MSIKGALALYFVLLATFVIVLIDPLDVTYEIAVSAIDSFVVLLWVAISRQTVLPKLKLPKQPLWLLAGAGIGFFTYAFASAFVSVLVWGLGIEEIGYTDAFYTEGYGLGFIVLIICVQPALIEELAFRGVIFTALQQVLSVREAMIVSSLMFAALHLTPLAFPHTFLLGLLAVWMLVKTGSMWPGIVLHFVHNSLAIISEVGWS